jgi:aspartyl-tRNA(Asn)/glutamyl-tRNA(Gln) amidotransferase subunit C
MPITESDIEKIAQLAHLDITDDERKMFAPQISEIITYVEQLNAIDTNAVEPALGGLTTEGERTETSRADEVQPSLGQKVALDQAPDPAAGHFRVPKVLA